MHSQPESSVWLQEEQNSVCLYPLEFCLGWGGLLRPGICGQAVMDYIEYRRRRTDPYSLSVGSLGWFRVSFDQKLSDVTAGRQIIAHVIVVYIHR